MKFSELNRHTWAQKSYEMPIFNQIFPLKKVNMYDMRLCEYILSTFVNIKPVHSSELIHIKLNDCNGQETYFNVVLNPYTRIVYISDYVEMFILDTWNILTDKFWSLIQWLVLYLSFWLGFVAVILVLLCFPFRFAF